MYKKILLGCDPEGLAEDALPVVVALARDLRSEVLVVGVEDPHDTGEAHDLIEHRLDGLVSQLQDQGVAARGELPRAGRREVAQTLAEVSQEWGADLIALGTHRRGELTGLVVGSVGHAVAARVDTPLLIAAAHEQAVGGAAAASPPGLDRILLALDYSEQSDAALHAVAELGAPNSTVMVVHALGMGALGAPVYIAEPEEEARGLLTRAVGQLEAAGKSATWELLTGVGPLPERIAEGAEDFDADLIVMGSRRLTDLGGLIVGSIAHGVIRQTQRPVLLAERPRARVKS
jgi:nucleotide-binding universal stress UspA family protein